MIARPYQPNTTADVVAAGLILRRDTDAGPRWLLLRATKHGEWGFPKGHQDNGETPLQTAQRECAEECGLALIEIDGPPLEAHYRLNNGKMKSVIHFPAVTTESEVSLSHEHDQYAWLDAKGVQRRLPHANLVLLFRAYLHGLGRD